MNGSADMIVGETWDSCDDISTESEEGYRNAKFKRLAGFHLHILDIMLK